MANSRKIVDDRLSRADKTRNNYQWYKDKTNCYDSTSENSILSTDTYSSRKTRMQINYNLLNNILYAPDFNRICKPWGEEGDELPTKMVNRDIISPKLKAVCGMASKRALNFKLLAVNPEATTRKELEEVEQMKNFVISQIMTPIKQEIELEYQEQLANKELTEDQRNQINQEIAEKEKARTPEEVKKYMAREHQDPSEILFNQLLNIEKKKQNIKFKLGKCLKHGLASAVQVMYIGSIGGKMQTWVVNPLDFDYDDNPDLEFIHQGDWQTYRIRMSPAKIVGLFGDYLSDEDIDQIYDEINTREAQRMEGLSFSSLTGQEEEYNRESTRSDTIEVLHTVFTSLRKIGIVSRLNEDGEIDEEIVDETYSINFDAGDQSIEWKWLPEKYETWRIGKDIYPIMQPVEGQFEDLDDLTSFTSPYVGVVYDADNSVPTGFVDRLKQFQYNYNEILYKVQNLMDSDEGKKILMNINALPDDSQMSLKKWQYFSKTTPYMWVDPNTEGTGYNDINTIAKQLDMSLMSDISKYIEMAEYIRQQAGRSVGVPDNVEGQTEARESVGNNQQNLVQTSNILEPYFDIDNQFQKEVIQKMLEVCKTVYRNYPEETLSHILDDMSIQLLKMDTDLLNNTKIGLFVSDSRKISETKELLTQLSHAAMQNDKMEMSDVIEMFEQESLAETKERLKTAERERMERAQAESEQAQKAQEEAETKSREFKREEHEMAKEIVILKEEEKRKTVVVQGAMVGASFNPDADQDNDGVNDYIEIARDGVNADIAKDKNNIERDKLNHQKQNDKEKNKLEAMKINKAQTKV